MDGVHIYSIYEPCYQAGKVNWAARAHDEPFGDHIHGDIPCVNSDQVRFFGAVRMRASARTSSRACVSVATARWGRAAAAGHDVLQLARGQGGAAR